SELDALELIVPKQISVGFWRRFGATLLDLFFLGITLNIAGAMLDGFYLIGHLVLAKKIGSILGVIIAILYYPILESSKYQASIGKRLLSIKVVDEEGERLTFGWDFARFLAKGISFV
ncbi:MAG: RDD family protein, partial [Aureispira sp.]|nr:RDD family protein [Aureispira sp.]